MGAAGIRHPCYRLRSGRRRGKRSGASSAPTRLPARRARLDHRNPRCLREAACLPCFHLRENVSRADEALAAQIADAPAPLWRHVREVLDALGHKQGRRSVRSVKVPPLGQESSGIRVLSRAGPDWLFATMEVATKSLHPGRGTGLSPAPLARFRYIQRSWRRFTHAPATPWIVLGLPPEQPSDDGRRGFQGTAGRCRATRGGPKLRWVLPSTRQVGAPNVRLTELPMLPLHQRQRPLHRRRFDAAAPVLVRLVEKSH
jgi:hypothetical protein